MKKDFYKKSKNSAINIAAPGIIIEKYLKSGKWTVPKDYKIFCFNGVLRYISVILIVTGEG